MPQELSISNKKCTSVLMGRAKNEAPHLLEWISYHKAIGFDDIVIFSNASTDGTVELLDRLSDAGIIRHVVCNLAPGETPDREMNAQLINYTKNFPFDWAALLDIDEYLLLKKHNSVSEFLADFGHADTIAINWRTFGSSGLIGRDGRLTIERFPRCGPITWPMNRWVKSIGRLSKITGGGPHYFYLTPDAQNKYHVSGKKFTHYADVDAIDATVASVNHYAIRSKHEYLMKRLRGDALVSLDSQEKINRYTDQFFTSRDNNEDEDRSILVHVSATKINMRIFSDIAGIRDLLVSIEKAAQISSNLKA